ncbi:MAG: fibrillarin-like rRNA/tRNA 2'-O-methyltransferase [Candidatus Hodarchaeota archaeon]
MVKDSSFAINPDNNFKGLFHVKTDNGVFLATRNLIPGNQVYGEKIFKVSDDEEYRDWNPRRSKLCGFLKNKGKEFHVKEGSKILYLGAANGTTVSHVSDIIGESGRIYALEFSARSIRELVQRLGERKNVVPILADATKPDQYRSLIPEDVDVLYQDIAQPEQSRILLDNINVFLKKEGYFYIAIKARSIDVSKDPAIVFKKEISILKRSGLDILEEKDLSPYTEDHVFLVGTNKI